MKKQNLLQLEKLANLSPKEIAKKQPKLFSQLSDEASETLKKKVELKLKNSPEVVKEGIKKIDFTPNKLGKSDVKTSLVNELMKGKLSKEKKKIIEEQTANLPDLGKLDDVLLPDIPVSVNPAFRTDLMKAKVYRLSDAAKIPSAKIEKAIGKELTLNSISSEKLNELVKDRTLTKKEAGKLALASNLHTLLDSSFELTEHVQKSVELNSLEDLVNMDREGWRKIVKYAKANMPKGMKKEEYADLLYKKVENLFPETALVKYATRVDKKALSSSIDAITPLLSGNKKAFGAHTFDDLNVENISRAEQKKIRTHYEFLERISRRNPGLKIDDILNDNSISAGDKSNEVKNSSAKPAAAANTATWC